MRNVYILFAIIVLGNHLYAQDTLDAQKVANVIGTAIVCDSLGRPYGEIYIVDSKLDFFSAGHVLVDLFTMQDMIHIDSVQVSDIWKRNDEGICCERISEDEECYFALSELIQKRVHGDLKGGFLVYPEKGLMREHVSRTLFQVKFQINTPLTRAGNQGSTPEEAH